MCNLFKTPYRKKRAIVLWTKAYKKKILARAARQKYQYNIDSKK